MTRIACVETSAGIVDDGLRRELMNGVRGPWLPGLEPFVQFVRDAWRIRSLPAVRINLMHAATETNHPFYRNLVREFFVTSRRRHRRCPLFRQFSTGVAICRLPKTVEEYLASIEASARRNVKKASRLKYELRSIDYNDHLSEVREIRKSADFRQGPVSSDFRDADVVPCNNPASECRTHDYAYFGVFRDGTLYAYAGCFICGEVCLLEHIYGHAAHQPDGIVPMLIAGIAEHLIVDRPEVRYYCYGTFFGARQSMRRFKTKFRFTPHRVTWNLD